MTVRVSKSAFNIREKLSELDKPTGLKGNELMRSDNAQDARNLIGAGRKNMIINGAMQVAQRGTSVAWAANGYLSCDRWSHIINSSAGRWTAKQTADGPDGFRRCLELDVTTADTSIAAAEHALLQYKWEGQDVQQLAKGTAGAKKFTVSFYVKGNGNATYMCEFFDRSNTRLIRQQFSVTSSWTRVVLTFNNETSNGTLNDDNSHELDMMIWLHAGSDFSSGTYTDNTWSGQTNANRYVGGSSIFSSTSNYFKITGVQVEIGENATEFEHRSFGEELQLCQRYYTRTGVLTGQVGAAYGKAYSTSEMFTTVCFPTSMRAIPTVTTYDNGGTSAAVHKLGNPNITSVSSIDRHDTRGFGRINKTSAWATGDTDMYSFTWEANAEL